MEFPYYHRPNVSQLEIYRAEIVAMRSSNWPFHKVATWLNEQHQVKISKEAIRQFCKVRGIGISARPLLSSDRKNKSPVVFEYDDSNPVKTTRKS